MQTGLTLVEDFTGWNFINSPHVVEDERFLKIVIEQVNADAIAIFMSCVLLGISVSSYCFWGIEYAIILLFGGLAAGSMFVGIMYSIAVSQRNQQLPCVDKAREKLVLASGTIIPKQEIECFRQYRCTTKMSRCRLVLTTVATHGSNGNREYAVIPVIGKFSEDCVGEALADFFGTELFQDGNQTFSASELQDLGLR